MKLHFSAAIVPVIALIGACSSSKGGNSSGPPADGGGGANADAGSSEAGDEASADDASTATEYDAALSSAQVVGTAVTTAATGTAQFFLQADGQTLTYKLTQNVASAQAVNLHIGAPGENGSVTHQLTPISASMTGSVTLTSDEQNAIALDQIYVDITSSAYPGGEVRGQLTAPGATIFVANPTGSQEVPAVTTQYTAHASFIISQDQATILYHLVTTAIPTNVLLEVGVGATNGQVAYPLTPVGQTIDGTLTTAASDPQNLLASQFYVNIQTAANEAGELRGQVIPIGSKLFTGVLAGANEVPPVVSQATGGVQLILGPDQKTLGYEAVVSGIIPTAMDLDNASSGQNGPMLYQLTLDQSGAQGQITVSSSAATVLRAGGAYVNVHTASYAGGELRAQLSPQ